MESLVEKKERLALDNRQAAWHTLNMNSAANNSGTTARCFWETSGDGKTRRLVREFYEAGRCVGFKVVVTETVPS